MKSRHYYNLWPQVNCVLEKERIDLILFRTNPIKITQITLNIFVILQTCLTILSHTGLLISKWLLTLFNFHSGQSTFLIHLVLKSLPWFLVVTTKTYQFLLVTFCFNDYLKRDTAILQVIATKNHFSKLNSMEHYACIKAFSFEYHILSW